VFLVSPEVSFFPGEIAEKKGEKKWKTGLKKKILNGIRTTLSRKKKKGVRQRGGGEGKRGEMEKKRKTEWVVFLFFLSF